MILRYLISMLVMSAALSSCGDQQQVSQQAQAQVATASKNSTTRVIIPAPPAGQTAVQNSPFANASKTPTEETRRMADLLNKSGKTGGSLMEAVQSHNVSQ